MIWHTFTAEKWSIFPLKLVEISRLVILSVKIWRIEILLFLYLKI